MAIDGELPDEQRRAWSINATADTITFTIAPANLADIDVTEYGQASYNATNVWAFGAWSDEYGYPSEVEFFSDRLCHAATRTDPQTIWMSQTGDYTNYGKSTPIVDSDAISLTINSRKVNIITDLVGLESLLILTANTEWKLSTAQNGVVSPDNVSFNPQSYNGASDTPALVVDNTALYSQKRGQAVRELSSDGSYNNQYGGRDISAFSNHLFENHSIVEWAYQQYPFSIIWAVRDDGILLCLTYMKEHDVIGWTRCETDGLVESICVVPEGDEDAVYIVVKREIEAFPQAKRYIERLSTRIIEDVRRATFLDSFLTYDGRITDNYINLSAGPHVAGNSYTLTSQFAAFAPTDINDYVVAHYDAGANGGVGARFRIINYTSSTVVTGLLETPMSAALATQTYDWGIARQELAAPAHLEGETVGIFADGQALADQVVPSGNMTIDPPGLVVCIGLRYSSDMETLEINVAGAETQFTKNKLVKELGVILQESRSVSIGPDFDHLDEIEAKQTTGYGLPDILDGTYEAPIRSQWIERGRVCVRQTDPLPITILGVVPEFKEGR